MVGVKYIGPVFDGCYDKKTEVLTSKGWKYFSELTFGDLLATVNSEGILEYHKPNQLVAKEWDGEMCHFYNSRAGVDLLVTPDHNMYVAPEIFRRKSGNSSGFRFEKADAVIHKYRLFKKDCINSTQGMSFVEICGRQINTEDWLEFLGYYLSEGSSTVTKDKHYVVQIRQFGDHLYKMARAVQNISPHKVNICAKDGRILLNDKDLVVYLKSTFGNKYEKCIPRHILNNCSGSQLKILLESLMLGDGHAPDDGGSSYTTASVQLRDDFMELLLKTGLSGSYVRTKKKGENVKIGEKIYQCKADNWTISVRWKQHICAVDGAGWNNGNATINKRVDYEGTVYCASVTNHTLFVRRNGKAVWCGNSGYAEAARNYVLTLHKKGYPVQLSPISFEASRPNLGENGGILRSLVNKPLDYDKVIVHCTPDLWPRWINNERGKYIIGYTVWETSQIDTRWVQACNSTADEIWLPCDWNIQVFKDSGVTKPLFKIPHAIDIPDLESVVDFNLQGIGEDSFVFYSIFQWQERKNPYGLLAAYTAAFSGKDDVVLVLKTYKQDHAEDKEKIRQLVLDFRQFINLDHYPKIFLVVENMSNEEMLSLHKVGDAFVLLQRSEGWGLPHFEAAACGNPVITPKYGGQEEFLKEDNSYLLDYTLTPVGGMVWSPYYKGNQYWCEPNMKQAIETMQCVYNNRNEAAAKGQKAKQYISENFTWDNVGDIMVERLGAIDKGFTR